MRPASVVSSVELETRKISEGKIIYILGPYADVRVYVCHMFVYLFVCSLGIAPLSPSIFSYLHALFIGQAGSTTVEYGGVSARYGSCARRISSFALHFSLMAMHIPCGKAFFGIFSPQVFICSDVRGFPDF